MKPLFEVADLFRAFGVAYREVHGHEMPVRHKRVMRAIEICRTSELGGHVDQCDQCSALRISYNSCRNRHCPKCQSLDKQRWLEAREKQLLPTSYFHTVFTLPEGIRPLALRNQKVVYNLLFQSASETLTELANDPKHLGAQIGYDSDHPLADGEVGKVGVAIDSLKDMEILFDGIPLDKVSTSMTINSTAAILLAMYIAVAEKQGVKSEILQGTIQNDILKEYAARGTYIYPPLESMRIVTDIFAFCKNHVQRWNTISISGYHMREAGCTAVQEVAFTLADGIAYVEAAIRAGLDVDSFASRLAFFFCCHNTFIEEVAKFRAARRLWAKIMRERFKAKKDDSCMLRFHTQTAGCSLTAQQPDNNVVRVAFQAMAAVLGGTQSLHTNSRDEAYALPTEDSVRIALRTQQIIAYETGVADMIDPLCGSYAVEALTDEIEKKAVDYIEKIEAMGGAIKAIESGYIQGEIGESAYQYQKEIERKKRIVVGLNQFQIEEGPLKEILRIRPEVEQYQKEKLAKVKKERDNKMVKETLAALKKAAQGSENIVPHILETVKAYATLGEISDTLREVFGEYRER